MAPSKPCAVGQLELKSLADFWSVLPADALYEILLRLPAKDLCRLRVVCHRWRSVISDPRFMAAHEARHPPLIVAGYPTGGVRNRRRFLLDILDLSGRVVKQVVPTLGRDEQVMCTQLDRVVSTMNTSIATTYQLLDPLNGAAYALPGELAEEHLALRMDMFGHRVDVVFGKVASTGEYKLLRIIYGFMFGRRDLQLFEVFTLHADHQWRKTKACPAPPVKLSSRAILNGTVYFFSDEGLFQGDAAAPSSKRIVSFDFATEEWAVTLREPPINHVSGGAGLAAMNGSLVVVHCVAASSTMDLWFLVDFEESLWVKRHSIQLNLSAESRRQFFVIPLLVLNDGRILAYTGPQGFLRIYDPNSSAYVDVAEMGYRVGVGVYQGNLLSLAAA